LYGKIRIKQQRTILDLQPKFEDNSLHLFGWLVSV